MRKLFFHFQVLAIVSVLIFISCKKERPCENCGSNPPAGGTNKSPIAKAGADQNINLPIDSVSLDGSASSDPDGTISSFQWTKISGPASFAIITASAKLTSIKQLVLGVYQFELKVTDNGGLSAKDTVQIVVTDPTQPNRPPVAKAGSDQIITLPTNTTNLNGSSSTDPDNNITNYVWTKISGPALFNIVSANAVQTQLTSLIQGIYQFELNVTDAGGLFSKDTMQVTVLPPCSNNGPEINATITQIATLSESRIPTASSAGNKVVFAGGWKYGVCGFWCDEINIGSSAVDIYNMNTQTWSATQLSKARGDISVVTAGSEIFFAGGYSWECNPTGISSNVFYDNVDIYNVSNDTWRVAHLSKARSGMAVATVGNKVLFAGGDISNRVDIYDLTTNQWSIATLSRPLSYLGGRTVGNKIYFDLDNGNVDIYDNNTNSWTNADRQIVIASLSPPPAMTVVDQFMVLGDNIVFWNSQRQVGVRNMTTGLTSVTCLFSTSPQFLVNNNLVFARADGRHFDIYNTVTGNWYIGNSNSIINLYDGGYPNIISSSNNNIYFGGGGDQCNPINKVYKLSW